MEGNGRWWKRVSRWNVCLGAFAVFVVIENVALLLEIPELPHFDAVSGKIMSRWRKRTSRLRKRTSRWEEEDA